LNVQGGLVQPGPLTPGQVKVTQEQYEAIAIAQVKELWSKYPGLVELWFDGGYRPTVKQQLTQVYSGLH
jgi:hypothetical protein